MEKKFALTAPDLKELAPGRGGCLASDHITVERQPIGFMYRELSDFEADSGWRFLSGQETPEYMDEPSNHGIYDVNTIANYDPDIVPHLNAPPFSAFERSPETGEFVSVPFPG